MTILICSVSILLTLTGLVFFLGAAVGLVRLPDFYTRMHAAGKGDTLSTILILAGVALYTLTHLSADHFSIGQLLVPVKILATAGFIMLTSPTSTHALMQSGYDDGISPFERPKEDSSDSADKEGPSRQPSASPPASSEG